MQRRIAGFYGKRQSSGKNHLVNWGSVVTSKPDAQEEFSIHPEV